MQYINGGEGDRTPQNTEGALSLTEKDGQRRAKEVQKGEDVREKKETM